MTVSWPGEEQRVAEVPSAVERTPAERRSERMGSKRTALMEHGAAI
jgi:hypothetical protein